MHIGQVLLQVTHLSSLEVTINNKDENRNFLLHLRASYVVNDICFFDARLEWKSSRANGKFENSLMLTSQYLEMFKLK